MAYEPKLTQYTRNRPEGIPSARVPVRNLLKNPKGVTTSGTVVTPFGVRPRAASTTGGTEAVAYWAQRIAGIPSVAIVWPDEPPEPTADPYPDMIYPDSHDPA